MNIYHKNILRRIYNIQRVYGYISSIELKSSVKKNQLYTIIIVSNCYTNEKIASFYRDSDAYSLYAEEYELKRLLPFYAFHVNLGNEHYYRIDWDDYYLGKYDKDLIGEIARPSNDYDENPLCFRDYVIYLYYEPEVTLSQFKENAETEDIKALLDIIMYYEKNHFLLPFKKETKYFLKYRNDYRFRNRDK